MNNAIAFLIMGMLFAITFGLAYFVSQKETRLAEQLHFFAIQHGWSFHRLPTNNQGYAFHGQQGGLDWELLIYRGTHDQLPSTIWQSRDANLPDSLLLIGAGLNARIGSKTDEENQQISPLSRVGMGFRTRGWGVFPIPDLTGLESQGIDLSELEPLPGSPPALQARFNVLGMNTKSARKVITPQVEQQLTEWPPFQSIAEAPFVLVDRDGVSVRLPNDQAVRKTDLVERIINLGLALAEPCRQVQLPGNI